MNKFVFFTSCQQKEFACQVSFTKEQVHFQCCQELQYYLQGHEKMLKQRLAASMQSPEQFFQELKEILVCIFAIFYFFHRKCW